MNQNSREQYFNFFNKFQNPLLNITFNLETVNFLAKCKTSNIPPFHFFLYCLNIAINKTTNFRYREFNNEIICIEDSFFSYTVLNESNEFNYAIFETCDDLDEFILRSQKAKKIAIESDSLIIPEKALSLEERKRMVFLTSLPWLEITSIQHPTFSEELYDIPTITWGRFKPLNSSDLTLTLSIQAHHGFVDGHHINMFAQNLKVAIEQVCDEKLN